MMKFVVLYPPQPDMDAFSRYYTEVHFPLAQKIPDTKSLRYSLDVRTVAGEEKFVCIFEAEFEDKETMNRSLVSAAGQAVSADAANFVKVPPVILQYSTNK